jgi:hypothetical protein
MTAFSPLDLSPDEIVRLVADGLRARTGAWGLGVVGGFGEWVPDETTVVSAAGPGRFVATAGGGILSLSLEPVLAAYARRRADGAVDEIVLVAPAVAINGVVTDLGPDGDGHLVDLGLGIGASTFAVRVDDGWFARLSPHLGRSWAELLAALGAELAAASPTRVITTPLGRLEITAPVPPPGGRSPDGCHTHLDGHALEHRHELPGGFALPYGLSAGASFYPPAGWAPANAHDSG